MRHPVYADEGPGPNPPAAELDGPERSREAQVPRILLLDDDPFALGTLQRTLNVLGFGAVEALTSPEAALLRLAVRLPAIDVVICDLRMPGLDGIDFLRGVANTGFQGGVVLLSGAGMHLLQSVRRLFEGACWHVLGVLSKPASRADLRRLLDSAGSPAVAQQRAGAGLAPLPVPFNEAELRHAHAAEQWVLHYQPKVEIDTRKPVGVEALLRWRHPRLGLVAPHRFIAIAEDCGLITDLSDWVLSESFAQQVRWREQGVRLRVSINLSMLSLERSGFDRHVTALAVRAGVRPQDVVLEVTESRVMRPGLIALESLVRLRMAGFGLAIDDFGTGHSSLVQLRDVPFTELKIDRSFVRDARRNVVVRPILEGSIIIARRLGMQSVAEGVEDDDDWQLLQELGCDHAQGWLVGRPMAAAQLPVWLRTWSAGQAQGRVL